MKHSLLILLSFLFCLPLPAQNTILGQTKNYGLKSGGLFRLPPNSQSAEIQDVFAEPLFETQGKFLLHSSGRLYGVCSYGANRSQGTIYSFDQAGEDFRTEYYFGAQDKLGSFPVGGLCEGQNGMIFGISGKTRHSAKGIIYRFDPQTKHLDIIYQFTALEAAGTTATLLPASDGWLYGTSPSGGQGGEGTIFRMSQDGVQFEVLYTFGSTSEYHPSPYLAEHPNGYLYGHCEENHGYSSKSAGTIFRFSPNAPTPEMLYHFKEREVPLGGLVIDGDGNLYGATPWRGINLQGMLFKTDSLGDHFANLLSSGVNGLKATVLSSPFLDSDGFLYGLCQDYNGDPGGLYRIRTSGNDFELLDPFQLKSEVRINPSLQKTASGFIGVGSFGTLSDDGIRDIIFRLNTVTTDDPVIYQSLYRVDQGFDPSNGLLLHSENIVYGITHQGGAQNQGVLFRADYCGSNYEVALEFDSTLLIPHIESMIEGEDGNIYAASSLGGSFDRGKLVSISPEDGTVSTVFDFQDDFFDGARVRIILHQDHHLYGFAVPYSYRPNIANRKAGIFRIRPDGTDFSVLKTFDSSIDPYVGAMIFSGSLMSHSNGKIYGGMQTSIFEYDPESGNFRVRMGDFQEHERINPDAMIEGPDHQLYGAATAVVPLTTNCCFYYSIIWKMDPDTGSAKFHADINANWQYPRLTGRLTVGPNSRMYGTDYQSRYKGLVPSYYRGFIFAVDTLPNSVQRVLEMDDTTGRAPHGSIVFVPDGSCPAIIAQQPPEMLPPMAPIIYPLSIFPNPTSTFVHVYAGSEGAGNVFLRDLQGRLLVTQELDPNTGSASVDLSGFPSGTYLVTISTQDITTTKKVVKW